MKRILIILRSTTKQMEQRNKYCGIIAALEKMGFDVWYTNIHNGQVSLFHGNECRIIGKVWCSRLQQFTRNIAIYRAVARLFRQGDSSFEYCYMRAFPAMPGLGIMFAAIKDSGSKIVVEIPTYINKSEMSTDTRWWRRLASTWIKKIEAQTAFYIDLYALIGETSCEYLGRPAVNITNGIDINSVSVRKPINTDGYIHILAMAKMARWHGYDRLIEGLRQYYDDGGKKEIFIHMVGPDGDGSLAEWKALAMKYKLADHVLFEGSMYGQTLDDMVNRCDIACDSLGMHRIGIPFHNYHLKTAEYIARGIPVIGTRTADGAEMQIPFFYNNISLDDTPIDMHAVVENVMEAQRAAGVARQMRQYAQERLGWETQLGKIFQYFEGNADN